MKIFALSILMGLGIQAEALAFPKYDSDLQRCRNAFGQEAYKEDSLEECSVLKDINSQRLKPKLDRLRDGEQNPSLRGLMLVHSNLEALDLSLLNLEGAIFSNVDLTQVNFSGSNLRNSVLSAEKTTGLILENADIRGADLFPELCKNQIEYHELSSKEKEMIGGEGMAFKEGGKLVYLPAPQMTFRPIDPASVAGEEFGLNEWDRFQILCAAKLGLCSGRPKRLVDEYELKDLPSPLLEKGIEFYHAELTDLESSGQARFVGFFELEVFELISKDEESPQYGSWLDRLESVRVLFNLRSL